MELIVAVYDDWGIGKDGTQPIALSADRKFFRETTRGAMVIVGRRTIEDFPGQKPLPGRVNVALTRKGGEIPGFTVCSSPEAAAELAKSAERAMVIGGGSIYKQMLPLCNKAYVTKVHVTPESDTFFPNLDDDPQWKLTSVLQSGEENGVAYEMCLYERVYEQNHREVLSMKVFNICDYGARFCDELQTDAIQKAIDDCFLAGGGRVVIPCGIFMTGDIRLRSNVELYLEAGAILKGSRDPEDYFHYQSDKLEPESLQVEEKPLKVCPSSISTSRWSNGLIRAFDAENISVIGEKGSYIDGSNCYDPQGENDFRGPHGMSFWRCRNIRLEGYTVIHSGNWAHAIFQSQNITVKRVSVYAGHDGVDVRTCDNVLIEDCTFNTGDDCVAGFDNHDVVVRNCLMNSSCMPVRFGGNNVLFENCRAECRNAFGFRMYLTPEEKIHGHITDSTARHDAKSPFSYYCDMRAYIRKTPGNIIFRNCHFEKAHELIRLEYTGRNRWCCNRSLESITYENCFIGGLTRAGMLWGAENEKVTCHFKNVTLSCEKGYEKEILLAAGNFEKIMFEDVTIEGYENPTILAGTDGVIEVIRSTPITVKESNLDECIEAHPGGVAFQDLANFKLNPKNDL